MKFTVSEPPGTEQKSKMCDIRQAASEMAENTAMHGLPHLKHSQSLVKKIFWVFVLLAAFALLIWQISMLIIKYYSYPVTTNTEIVFNSEINFPAVTFCNLNPVRKSKVISLPRNQQALLNRSLSARAKRTNTTVDPYNNNREEFAELNNFYWNFLGLQVTHRMAVGHQLDEMLIDCTYNGKLCGPENFTTFHNWQYGNCFTFNSGRSQPIRIVRQPGPLNGLSMRIYAQSLEYIPILSSALGVKMVIHNQSAMPFPENEGFIIRTGSFTQVGVRTTFISREDPPHGKCRNYSRAEAEAVNVYMSVLNSTEYTRQGCINTCKQKTIMKNCGCASVLYPSHKDRMAYRDLHDSVKTRCYFNNNTAMNCHDNEIPLRKCGDTSVCPDRCVDFQYFSTSTQAKPTNSEQVKALDDLMSLADDNNDLELKRKLSEMTNTSKPDKFAQDIFIEENVIIVDIYLEDLSYLSYTTQASFGLEDFLSSLGGCGGLWLGISVMTIFELCEFFINIFAMLCRREKRDNDSPAVVPTC